MGSAASAAATTAKKAAAVVVHLHPAWGISKQDVQRTRPQLHIHLVVSLSRAAAVLQMLLFFFSPPPTCIFPQSELKTTHPWLKDSTCATVQTYL